MAEEFTINSTAIEDKINQLLPSQGGFGAGVDFSASTMVIPIVDLTETASGSALREDLQSSFSHGSLTAFIVNSATTTTLVATTGYYRVFGTTGLYASTTTSINITDGSTVKIVAPFKLSNLSSGSTTNQAIPFDFIVKLEAGDSLTATSSSGNAIIQGCTRQIADLAGNLTNP